VAQTEILLYLSLSNYGADCGDFFVAKVHVLKNSLLRFGGIPDHDPDPGILD